VSLKCDFTIVCSYVGVGICVIVLERGDVLKCWSCIVLVFVCVSLCLAVIAV
jgi:hypothetical protein